MKFEKHFLRSVRLDERRSPPPDRYPFSLPAVRAIAGLEFHPSVTFLVGENGSGKSTLLEAVAVRLGLNPEGGSKNFKFSTRESHSELCDHLVLVRTARFPRDCWFLRAESFFNVATEIEQLDSGGGPGRRIIESYGRQGLHSQSHGESFFALFNHRLGGEGLYLLDEPEAALSPARQMAFLAKLHELVGRGSQFIIATHSPIIMSYPSASIYVIGQHGVRLTALEETEHFRVTRDFLANPARSLKELME